MFPIIIYYKNVIIETRDSEPHKSTKRGEKRKWIQTKYHAYLFSWKILPSCLIKWIIPMLCNLFWCTENDEILFWGDLLLSSHEGYVWTMSPQDRVIQVSFMCSDDQS